MSFPESDRFWFYTYKFIEQYFQTEERIIAPKEFKEKFDNITDYSSTKYEEIVKNFQWIVLHKGRLDELEINLLKQIDHFFKPVYANEVFVVFSIHKHLSSLELNPTHIQAFTEKLTELIQSNIANHNNSRVTNLPAVYLGNNTALTKTIYGHKLYVDTRDLSLTPHLLLDGYWESWITKLFLNIVKPGMCVVEVGANVGYYSLLAASQVGINGSLYTFEANPRMYDLLRKNLDINGFLSIANYINKAVTNRIGIIEFAVFKEYLGSSFISSLSKQEIAKYPTEIIKVESTSLDVALGNNIRVDILKIDAEGSEPLIIKGAYNLLKNNHDIKLIIEFNISNFEKESQAYEYLKSLRDMGFKINLITEDSLVKLVKDQELVNQPGNYELFLFR